jgi:hypothetical protein
MTVARRVVLVLLLAGVCLGAGSALFASSAFAGGVDTNSGLLSAAIYNLTPYTWTLVAAETPGITGWSTVPQATIPAGGSSLYQLRTNYNPGTGFFCAADYLFGFDAYITYRVDVVDGPPEYVTLAISGAESHNPFPTDCGPFPAGDHHPEFDVFITTAPPPFGAYDPAASPGTPPAPQVTNPQLTYSHNVPQLFDQTVAVVGDYKIDASTDQGQPFVDLLNALCSGADGVLDGATCSFTRMTPITYGPGAFTDPQAAINCDLSAAAGGSEPSTPTGKAPPDSDPNYYLVEYEAAQSASLSVGAGITVSAEFELFEVIKSEASVTVEAEHEWEEVKTYTRETKVFIPSNSRAFVWVAPTVGRVTGTLVATIGSATFTASNFTEVRSGVTGDTTDSLTQPIPAFNVVSKTRPMTADEKRNICHASASSRSASSRLKARRAAPPARLVPGRSIAGVALGETQEAVVARLGWPDEKRFALKPCKGLPGCTAAQGLGGTWTYKKRKLSVVFDPDRRVAALIHSGSQRTADGVGKDSTPAAVRGKFPRVSCKKFRKKIDCTLKRVSGQQTVMTVFRLTDRGGGRWKTKQVLIYVDGRGRGNA